MDPARRRRIGLDAATDAGARLGWPSAEPVVLQDTNNVVVWLAPHPVVAKVGMWPHSAEMLQREVAVAQRLAALAAPVAAPLAFVPMDSSWPPLSLWTRLEPEPGAGASPDQLATMLRRVHAALATGVEDVPSFRFGLDLARATLRDDDAMHRLPPADLAFLRARFDELLAGVPGSVDGSVLHGEPHAGNVVVTAAGPFLVDFEAVCRGPIEWDLASVDPAVVAAYGPVDADRLAHLRMVNSARIATWGWAGAAHEAMRAVGQQHLALLRAARA